MSSGSNSILSTSKPVQNGKSKDEDIRAINSLASQYGLNSKRNRNPNMPSGGNHFLGKKLANNDKLKRLIKQQYLKFKRQQEEQALRQKEKSQPPAQSRSNVANDDNELNKSTDPERPDSRAGHSGENGQIHANIQDTHGQSDQNDVSVPVVSRRENIHGHTTECQVMVREDNHQTESQPTANSQRGTRASLEPVAGADIFPEDSPGSGRFNEENENDDNASVRSHAVMEPGRVLATTGSRDHDHISPDDPEISEINSRPENPIAGGNSEMFTTNGRETTGGLATTSEQVVSPTVVSMVLSLSSVSPSPVCSTAGSVSSIRETEEYEHTQHMPDIRVRNDIFSHSDDESVTNEAPRRPSVIASPVVVSSTPRRPSLILPPIRPAFPPVPRAIVPPITPTFARLPIPAARSFDANLTATSHGQPVTNPVAPSHIAMPPVAPRDQPSAQVNSATARAPIATPVASQVHIGPPSTSAAGTQSNPLPTENGPVASQTEADSDLSNDLNNAMRWYVTNLEKHAVAARRCYEAIKNPGTTDEQRFEFITSSMNKSYKTYTGLDEINIQLRMKYNDRLPKDPNTSREPIEEADPPNEILAEYFQVLIEAMILSKRPRVQEQVLLVLMVLITRIIRILAYFICTKHEPQRWESKFTNVTVFVMGKRHLVETYTAQTLSSLLLNFWQCIRGSNRGVVYRKGALMDHAMLGPQKFLDQVTKFKTCYEKSLIAQPTAPTIPQNPAVSPRNPQQPQLGAHVSPEIRDRLLQALRQEQERSRNRTSGQPVNTQNLQNLSPRPGCNHGCQGPCSNAAPQHVVHGRTGQNGGPPVVASNSPSVQVTKAQRDALLAQELQIRHRQQQTVPSRQQQPGGIPVQIQSGLVGYQLQQVPSNSQQQQLQQRVPVSSQQHQRSPSTSQLQQQVPSNSQQQQIQWQISPTIPVRNNQPIYQQQYPQVQTAQAYRPISQYQGPVHNSQQHIMLQQPIATCRAACCIPSSVGLVNQHQRNLHPQQVTGHPQQHVQHQPSGGRANSPQVRTAPNVNPNGTMSGGYVYGAAATIGATAVIRLPTRVPNLGSPPTDGLSSNSGTQNAGNTGGGSIPIRTSATWYPTYQQFALGYQISAAGQIPRTTQNIDGPLAQGNGVNFSNVEGNAHGIGQQQPAQNHTRSHEL